MVAKPILRNTQLVFARAIAAAAFLAVLTVARFASADDAPRSSSQQVVVIDLAKGDSTTMGAELKTAIAKQSRLELADDAELATALTGDVTDGLARSARAALKTARAANPCQQATAEAGVAILQLAALQAMSVDVRSDLIAAYTITFRCAHERGEASAALARAQTLRALGLKNAPEGIDDPTWATYPELDGAANVTMAAVTVKSARDGDDIWIDHVRRGKSPLTVHIRQGQHVVASASKTESAAALINVNGWTHSESLVTTPTGRWSKVAALVGQLRSGKRSADASSIGEVMSLAGVDYALVMVSGGTIEAWRTRNGGAKRVGQRRDAAQAVELLADTTISRAPDPSLPLLRETEAEKAARTNADDDKPTKWWVYAAVVGAAAIGAGIIIFGPSGEDRQRFEITLP